MGLRTSGDFPHASSHQPGTLQEALGTCRKLLKTFRLSIKITWAAYWKRKFLGSPIGFWFSRSGVEPQLVFQQARLFPFPQPGNSESGSPHLEKCLSRASVPHVALLETKSWAGLGEALVPALGCTLRKLPEQWLSMAADPEWYFGNPVTLILKRKTIFSDKDTPVPLQNEWDIQHQDYHSTGHCLLQ